MPGIVPLTTGIIERIMSGEEVEKPVLQILGAKKIAGADCERLRLLVSDGKYFNSFAMLATQLNHLHFEGKLGEFTIVQVDKYITSMVNKTDTSGKRVLIILELTVLNAGSQVGKKIGSPVVYTEASGSSSSENRQQVTNKAPPKVESKPAYTKDSSGSGGETSVGTGGNNAANQSFSTGFTCPISALSPYQNKWVIKVRVTAKSAIRTWSNARGEGKLFSMDLMDESGEIRATVFKEQCDKFYNMIEVDQVYFISKCQLKPANKQFCTLKNDYEMSFTNETIVQPCEEVDSGIPEIKFNFIQISQIATIDPKDLVDTIGICKDVGELLTFTSRTTNKEFKKRELTLVDPSDAAINVTLWGDEAVNFKGIVPCVILVKGVRVTEFNGGKSLSMTNSSVMKINPDIPESHKIRFWFDNGGGENISTSISARSESGNFNNEWLTFYEIVYRNLGAGDKADYFMCKALIQTVRTQNALYKACPQPECNKKVIEEGDSFYRCERCKTSSEKFKYRLLVNMSICDWTSNRWVTCFSDVAEQLLKHTSQEIGEIMEKDPEKGGQILLSLNMNSYIFKLRCKMEMFGDMNRNKITVQSASPINYKEYNKYLIKNIKELSGIDKM